jgi:hypothetical protein
MRNGIVKSGLFGAAIVILSVAVSFGVNHGTFSTRLIGVEKIVDAREPVYGSIDVLAFNISELNRRMEKVENLLQELIRQNGEKRFDR